MPTRSQIEAARLLIQMLEHDGEPVDPALRAIADSTPACCAAATLDGGCAAPDHLTEEPPMRDFTTSEVTTTRRRLTLTKPVNAADLSRVMRVAVGQFQEAQGRDAADDDIEVIGNEEVVGVEFEIASSTVAVMRDDRS